MFQVEVGGYTSSGMRARVDEPRAERGRGDVSGPVLIRRLARGGVLAAMLAFPVIVLSGCLGDDPTRPLEAPVAMADIRILTQPATNPDPLSHATCQTASAVALEAHGSGDPAGQPVTFEWRDEVDYGDGTGRHLSTDWGSSGSIARTTEFELRTNLYTIAIHYVTLTVRARDGRSAKQTLRVTVTSCEVCGG